jgi:hypothetical protein
MSVKKSVQMCFSGDNSVAFETAANNEAGKPAASARAQVSNNTSTMVLSPEVFVGLELSIVSGVERVYVQRVESRTMRVMVMVKDRDAKLRKAVYAREQAIIDAHPKFEFDFYLHPLMGRKPEDVVDGIGKLAYKRFK